MGKAIIEQMDTLRKQRAEAVTKQAAQATRIADREQAIADATAAVAAKEEAHLRAANESQLHSFTAMVYGKNPTEVSDAEVHWFLRVFVFLPSIFVALASSFLAISAYERAKPTTRRERKRVEVDLAIEATDGTLPTYIRDEVHNAVKEHLRAEAAEPTQEPSRELTTTPQPAE